MLCRLPAHLGRVLWPPQQPGGGGPVLPLLPWECEAQTQTSGVQHGALPGQVIDCTAKLHQVFAHRVSPWIFSILCPLATATSKSCRTTCTTHCLGMSRIKYSATSALLLLSASPFFYSQLGKQPMDSLFHLLWRRHPESLRVLCGGGHARSHHSHGWVEVSVLTKDGHPAALQRFWVPCVVSAGVVTRRCTFLDF